MNVLLNKLNPEDDVILTTILMQKIIEFGGRLIGIVNRISHQERELLDV